MQYLGGKTRIAKQLAAEIDKVRRPGQLVWDAFCGGLSMSRALLKNGPVISTDACAPLIHLYRAVQNGWLPPTEVDEATWRAAKTLPDADPMKAFCGFGCSFSGMWFSAWGHSARPDRRRGYAHGTRKTLLRDVSPRLTFGCVDFLKEEPRPLPIVIYCDPPYRGTAGYRAGGPFDHDVFIKRAHAWARFCPVFVSEYEFPGPVVFQVESNTTVRSGLDGAPKKAMERLFYLAPGNTTAPDAYGCTPGAVTTQKAEE